jgi:hypothetical protein
MKGYVEVVFTQAEVCKIRTLVYEVDQYNGLDKEDQFGYITKESKFLWWRYTSKQLVADISDRLSPFFRHTIYDEEYYGCKLSKRGEGLIALAKLLRNNPTTYLGEELCGIVNFLRNNEYI